MSIPVDLDDLPSVATGHGPAAYLLTVSDDGRPHAVLCALAWSADGSLLADTGNRTAANVAARPLLCVLWPSPEPGGHSLIVDGDGEVIGEGAARRVRVRPTGAVLHRPIGA